MPVWRVNQQTGERDLSTAKLTPGEIARGLVLSPDRTAAIPPPPPKAEAKEEAPEPTPPQRKRKA